MIPDQTNARTSTARARAGTKQFRRLRGDEMVSRGDFIRNDRQEFEPWAGPSGFRADAFVNPIYRQTPARVAAVKK